MYHGTVGTGTMIVLHMGMWNPCGQLVVVAWWTLEGVGTALASQTFTVVASRCKCIVTSPRSGGDMDISVVSRQSLDA
jgi:hypothetical protein